MKTAFYGYRADIIGLLWLATALFFSLALSSYYPLDPSFNSVGVLTEVQNLCGYLGSFLADLLYQCFGLGAWILVLLALRQSMLAFQRRLELVGGWLNLSATVGCALAGAGLLELHQPGGGSFFQGHIYPGGIVGRALVRSTEPYLHFAGQAVALWSSAVMLLVVLTKGAISGLFIRLLFMLRALVVVGAGALLLYLQKGFGKLLGQSERLWAGSFAFCKSKLKKPEPSTWFSFFPALKKAGGAEEEKGGAMPLVAEEKNYFFEEEKAEKPDTGRELRLPPGEEKSSNFSKTLSTAEWKLPSAGLLSAPAGPSLQLSAQDCRQDAERLLKKLKQFSISGEITQVRSGPVITLFEFKPEDHVKVARITQMEDDLMIALKSKSIRIIAPIPGRDVVGIETAHTRRQTVYLKSLIEETIFWKNGHPLPLVLGRCVDGSPAIKDLGKIPHLMVAGSTGSGKSVFIISFLLSLLFRHTPQSLRLLLVDPKRVDLSVFEGLPHLLAPPVRESRGAVQALQWCLSEMYKRYRSLARFHSRDLTGFNEKVKNLSAGEIREHEEAVSLLEENEKENYYFSPQPYICVVLEEFGDLMSSPDRSRIENMVVRLAQMARACGIHLILSMQSPRKDVVTGLIKTNIPGRISFKVSSRIDSRIILDEGGAERLLSQGDMLYLGPGQARPERYHGPFVREEEALSVVRFWKEQAGEENFYAIKSAPAPEESLFVLPSAEGEGVLQETDDRKYEEIFSYVSDLKEVSASHLQRKYGLGYPRAARLIDKLEEEGVVGPARGSKPREVLIK